ncbi:hypothetical protein Y032_0017g3383 [Ancylostoma ceylanicum]|uniref:Endonuclease/exonuclease/phosphatase domain-containing protein n=1 Tax=Ancylostoma ceylanicum TaxID=53326 RepID=A0A016V5G5_9BILA|nr:hypothetical protein Y032_0017g3383 [Ancylostoma ceylanicum]
MDCAVKGISNKAKASPGGDALHHNSPGVAKSGQGLLAIKGHSKERKYRTIRPASIIIGTLTGRSRELAATPKKRKVDIACVQETRWKGAKSRDICDGCKLIYHGTTSGPNGVGVIVNNDYRDFVTSVQRVPDRLMSITEGRKVLRIVYAYAPQCGCTDDTKGQFYRSFEELPHGFVEGENVIRGRDFNGHVGPTRDGYERWHGGQGYGARNEMGTMLLDHAKAADLTVVNTFFKEKNENLITYRSGGRATQIDYILVRRKELMNVIDAKVIPSDNIAPQYHLLVMDMRLEHWRSKRSHFPSERIK